MFPPSRSAMVRIQSVIRNRCIRLSRFMIRGRDAGDRPAPVAQFDLSTMETWDGCVFWVGINIS